MNLLPQKHIVGRYLETCQKLNIENDGMGLDYFISPEDEMDLSLLPIPLNNGYIGWVVGAKQNTKKFPAEKIISVIHQINYPIVLLGGKEDEVVGEKIKASFGNKQLEIFNACGKYSLSQSASLVKQAKLIVTNDTGLMHVAAAFKKPIISLWGNTIPEFGMSPYYGSEKIRTLQMQIKNLDCRPCSKLGYDTCPKGHFKCMNLLSEKEIANAIEKFMS